VTPQLKLLFFLSLFVAVLAFAIPWLTHFADRGFSVALLLLWLGLLITGLIQHRRRGLWLLLGAPLALFWPVVIAIWASGPVHFGF
jgi:hypothetical protein